MTDTEARLDLIRGTVLPQSHNARTIAALTSNPGCAVSAAAVTLHALVPPTSGGFHLLDRLGRCQRSVAEMARERHPARFVLAARRALTPQIGGERIEIA